MPPLPRNFPLGWGWGSSCLTAKKREAVRTLAFPAGYTWQGQLAQQVPAVARQDVRCDDIRLGILPRLHVLLQSFWETAALAILEDCLRSIRGGNPDSLLRFNSSGQGCYVPFGFGASTFLLRYLHALQVSDSYTHLQDVCVPILHLQMGSGVGRTVALLSAAHKHILILS